MKAAAAARGKRGGKGKAARRNAGKNASHVLEYIEALEAATSRADLETYMESNSVQLARVTRQSGAGRLKVTLQDGTADTDVIVAGALRFKGRSSTKTDRPSCMSVDDLVVLHGPQAAGKIPRELFGGIQAGFDRLSVSYPKGFFAQSGSAAATEEDMGYEWDGDEEAVTATLTAAAGKPAAAVSAKERDKAKGKAKSGAGGGAAAGADDGDDGDFDVADI